jgi:hypothetical protein
MQLFVSEDVFLEVMVEDEFIQLLLVVAHQLLQLSLHGLIKYAVGLRCLSSCFWGWTV